MGGRHGVRFLLIGLALAIGVSWALASAQEKEGGGYPNAELLVSGQWLQRHQGEPNLVAVDVRADEHFDGRAVPGAVRLPWSLFREDDPARGLGSVFVGAVRAQEILGRHGLSRIHHLVLYDSVERDGGATASYVFWVLDLLGHERVSILERGIDGWADAGGRLEPSTAELEPVLYQAPADEIRVDRLVSGDFLYTRLGDPHYQILDVRSRGEYLGEVANQGLTGGPLKLGHVPTAVNVDYQLNWQDTGSKAFKSYADLRALYRGLDPDATVIPYCHSARRSSFTYFVLRLMGFDHVGLYEASWFEWGNPKLFYPVETEERRFAGAALPGTSERKAGTRTARGAPGGAEAPEPSGGYVSCGG